MNDLLLDLRCALRGLAKSPGFTAIAIVTLGLGIGAGTAIFSVADSVLFRPLAYVEPERLVAVFEPRTEHPERRDPTSPANYLDWRRDSATLERMTAAHPWSPVLRGEGRPERLEGLLATPDLFRLLGVEPALGRGFDPELSGEARVVVLGHDLWQRRFGGDPAIVGRSLELDGEPFTVAGVMPDGFAFPPFWNTQAELWAPLVFSPEQAARRGARFLRVFARLKPEVSLAAARAELAALGERLAEQHPEDVGGHLVRVEPLHEPVVGDVRGSLHLLLASVGLVLLIACANVAHLLLVRAAGRRRELALRVALGAARARLVRQWLVESALLAVAGALVGSLLAAWLVAAVVAFGPAELPRLGEIGFDGRIFAFALGLALLSVLLCGLAPALAAVRRGFQDALRAGSRQLGAGDRSLSRSWLVIGETALAVVLLVGASLLLESFVRLWRLDPGFRSEGLLTLSISLAGSSHESPEAQEPFLGRLREEVAGLPGVEAAALVNHLPIGGDLWHQGFGVEGREGGSDDLLRAASRVVSPGYFSVMGVPVLEGRGFDTTDRADSAPVVVVSRSFAQLVSPGRSAVGLRLRAGLASDDNPWLTVVGVVGDARQWSLRDPPRPEVYFPYAQNPFDWYTTTSLVAQVAGDPDTVRGAVADRIWALDRQVAVSQVRTMEEILTREALEPSFAAFLVALFALLALVLAAVGLYGVMSFAVSQRRSEIGVRIALGAERGDVVRMVVGRGLLLTGLGLAVGTGAALALGRFLDSLLFEVTSAEPRAFALSALVLLTAALLATALPAQRAARIDPARNLRVE